ncbi:hypothetical protein [uncultured Agrococcus sp.]|uniref:hypothetical protein n=1 Tax=uncultured Agrococcus sp. TaxID=382258 RepID=UPI0025EF96D8|nr:hypothetical protein [uncultured Agrococcus sp.]
MAATLRISLFALVGLLAAAILSQIQVVFFLFDRFLLGSSPSSSEWSENYALQWLQICLVITVTCLLTAGAFRFRFFAVTVGTALIALPVGLGQMLYGMIAGWPGHFMVLWPSWPFELTTPVLGCVLIVIHFLHRPRSDPRSSTAIDEVRTATGGVAEPVAAEQEPASSEQAVMRSVGATRA